MCHRMAGIGSKSGAGTPREHRYYKRVTASSHTICWGLALAIGLTLPTHASGRQATSPAVPVTPIAPATPAPPPTPAAPAASYLVAWSEPLPSVTPRTLLVLGDAVFTAGAATPLAARDLQTGATRWKTDARSWTALATSAGLVLAIGDGTLYAYDAHTGDVRWTTPVGQGPAYLTTTADRIAIAAGGYLRIYTLPDARPLWEVPLSAGVTTRPAIADDLVSVGLADGSVDSFDLTSGALQQHRHFDDPPESIAAGAGRLYVSLPHGDVCASRDRADQIDWCLRLRIPLVGAPLVGAKALYVVLYDNTLRVHDLGSGAMAQRELLGARAAAGPLPAGPRVVVPLLTGAFFVLQAGGHRLPPVPAPDSTAAHVLQQAAAGPDGDTLATVTVSTAGVQTLTVYRRPSPPPVSGAGDRTAATTEGGAALPASEKRRY